MISWILIAYIIIAFGFSLGAGLKSHRKSSGNDLRRLVLMTTLFGLLWPLLPFMFLGQSNIEWFERILPFKLSLGLHRFVAPYLAMPTCADLPNAVEPNIAPQAKLPTDVKKAFIDEWFSEQGGHCPDCRMMMSKLGNKPTKATVDHILARKLGGSNRLRNLRICCNQCNQCNQKKSALESRFL